MKPERAPIQLSPQNILVVDDEAHVREFLVEALSSMGYDVQTAADGLDALEKLQNNSFNIVVTDMGMPRMDGMGLIKYLNKHRNDIDIIAITGFVEDYTKTDVIRAGANDYLTKPFTLDDLEARLTRLIRDQKLVRTDPLTNLYNRRYFLEIVREEVVRAMRYGHPLCLFFIDIDRFRDYNNKNGHGAGDALLRQFAEVVKASVREYVDGAFRWGGDEFIVLMPHLSVDNARDVAERIRRNYKRLDLKPTTLSIGVAALRSENKGKVDDAVNDLILRADNALLLKHRFGRDRVYTDWDAPADAMED